MNLDDRTLSLLALQLIVLTALGGAILLAKTSASTRAWSIRLTILLGIALVCISQLPVTRSLPDNRPVMLPPQMMAVSAINQKLQNIEVQTTLPSERGASVSISVAQVWGGGIAIGLLWCAFATIKMRRLKRRSTHFTTVQGLEVRVAAKIGSPLVAGLMRQTIYLPEGLAEKLSHEELQLVFAHEIAHVEHRDLLWKMMHRLACVFFWPNIALWALVRSHDRAMEELADARASQVSNSPERYAALLLDIAQRRVGKDPSFALAMARRQSNIGRRIKRILGGESLRDLKPVHRLARFSTAFVSLIIVGVLIAGFGWQKAPKDPVKYGWQVPTGMVDFHILAPGGGEATGAHAWMVLTGEDLAVQTQELPVDNGWVHVDLSKISGIDHMRILAKDMEGNIGIGLPRPGALKSDLLLIKAITVKGVLKEPDGSPAEGIQISADRCILPPSNGQRYPSIELRNSPLASTAVTDANGAFALTGVAGECIIQASISDPEYQQPLRAIKHGTSTSFGLEIGAGPIFDLGEIKLERAGTISGRVTLDGKGVPGIRVGAQIISDDMMKSALSSWGDGITDANGEYLIGNLSAARYNVAIFMPKDLAKDYACAAIDSLTVEVGKRVTQEDLKLERGGIVEGEIFLKGNPDPEGYPVAYYGPDHPESGAWCGPARCDAKGHFRIRVAPGKQRVYLSMAQPYVGTEVTVQAGEAVHVTLKE